MPKPHIFDMDIPTVDPNGIAEAQTTGGAANLVLNGALCDPGTAAQFDVGDTYPASVAGVRMRWGSATEGVNLTFTGTNANGTAVTEVIAGAAGSPAVDTVQYWSQITQIAASGAIAVNTTVGDAFSTVSKTLPLNWRSREPATYVLTERDHPAKITHEEYFLDPQSVPLATGGWQSVTGLLATEGATVGTLHARAYRAVTSTAGGEVQVVVLQN